MSGKIKIQDSKKSHKKYARNRKMLAVFLIAAMLGSFFYWRNAQAAALTTLSDTMSRLKASTASNHDIRFRTPTGMSASTMKIYFNTAGFDDGSVDYTDIDLQYGSSQSEVNGSCTSNCTEATLAAAAGAGTWGAVFATNDLTFSYPTSGGTAIAANDYVRVLIGTNATEGATGDQQMTNPVSTGTKVITLEVAGTTDTGSLAVVIITTDDQVVVSTTIDPYITFVLTDNAVTLVTAADGNPSYTATGYNKNDTNTLAVSTNGTSGYTLTYTGATLTSGGNTITAIGGTPAASTTNTEQFGLNLKNNSTPDVGADENGGSGTPAADYNAANSFAYEAGATPINLASASAASATTTFTVSYIANVTQTTEAGNYNTTITYIATGNF